MLKNLLLVFSLLILSSCSSKPVNFNDAKKHMIESEKISLLMHELDMEVYERSKSELDRDNSRKRYAISLASVLKKLATSIEVSIPKSLSEKDLSLYRRYVKELYTQADSIDVMARRYQFDTLDEKLKTLRITCTNCHKSFRKN